MKTTARVLGLFSTVFGALVLRRVRSYQGFMVKATATAQTPALTLLGTASTATGLVARSPFSVAAGLAAIGIGTTYIVRATAAHDGFARAFGPDWKLEIDPAIESKMMNRRLTLRAPDVKEPHWTRDVPFATIPDSGRVLVADIWEPPDGVNRSGIAIVYLYGGSWHFFDKDVFTRPFFRQLAAQGHVVMDAAHRSCPETDLTGMVADVHRAVAWMKANAEHYGVDPDRIVTMGGSSGGHIALLAAYAPWHPQFRPAELKNSDTSVMGVVSYYGIPEMQAVYERAKEQAEGLESGHSTLLEKPEPGKVANAMNRLIMGRTLTASQSPPGPPVRQLWANLLGGQPEEVPEMYELASPLAHVSPICPPTLMFQGTHDVVVPTEAARSLAAALERFAVPVVYVEYPWTEHAFDLMYPPLANPAAKAALYDLERFLAVIVARRERSAATRNPASQDSAFQVA